MKTINPLIQKFADQPRWVTWRREERDGKTTKVPYQLSGRLASSTDAKTWATYKEIKEKNDNVGIVLFDKKLLVVDLDNCLVDEKLTNAQIFAFIADSETYCEISPSKNGLHVFFEISEEFIPEANRHEGVEIYTHGRYMTVTGTVFGKEVYPVRTLTPKEATDLLARLGYPWGSLKKVKSEQVAAAPVQKVGLLDAIPTDQLLERMFAASNGADIRALYDGDTSKYDKDISRADMALLSHLAFWTGKNAQQMEEIWLASPAGKRKKTLDRQDYRTRTINVAILNCDDVYSRHAKGASETTLEELGLLFTMKGKVPSYYKNTENMTRILQRHPEFVGAFRFDSYRSVIERRVNGVWRDLEDRDAVDIQTRISVLFPEFAHVSKEMVYDALIKVAYDNIIDSGADYLRSLVWDNTPRLDTWLHHAYNTPSDEYHRTVGGNWLKGLVKRVVMPGCKFDYVLVLEGKQGIKKSTSLAVLGGNLGHTETTIATDQKDFFLLMQGNAIIEFSEGESLSRTEVKQLKSVISTQVDKYRQPYGRATTSHPRRCVFAMTTNQTEYLKDETGNRRWLPVSVKGTANLSWIEENREQLLAEAYVRAVSKQETVYEFPEEELEAAQIERRVKDPNIDAVVNWYWSQPPSIREAGVTVLEVWLALHGGFMSRPMTRGEEMSIGDVLRTWLRLESKRVMILLQRSYRYFPTEKTKVLEPALEDLPQRSALIL